MPTSLAGSFLIALPVIEDPRFKRAVVLMCAHTEQSAMGIVVNRVIDDLTLTDVLDQLGVDGEKAPANPVLLGGPVGPDRGFVLHSEDFDCPGATVQVMDDVCLTTSREIISALASDDPPEQAILALGYAGWGPGQLENELASNAWLVSPGNAELVFNTTFETKWTRALASIGVSPEQLPNSAGNA